MRLYLFRTVAAILFLASVCVPAWAADLTGSWNFSVDLENGEHGDPVFVLKQLSGKITGTYRGPFGEQKATGDVNGDTVALEVVASADAGTVKLSYAGKIQAEDKMSGTMTRDLSGKITRGTWTATRRK
jgi:hypothetical protein